MKLEVNISKTRFFFILGVVLILAGVIAGYAYSTTGTGGNPPVFGHSVDEIDWTKPIPGDIVLKGVKNWIIHNRDANADIYDNDLWIAPYQSDNSAPDWSKSVRITQNGDVCIHSTGKCLSQIGSVGGAGSGGFTNMQVFDSSTTWTKPEGVTKIMVEVWGAGGAGSRLQYCFTPSSCRAGAGGGAGGYAAGIYTLPSAATSYSIVVGEGGKSCDPAAGDSRYITSTAGGSSSFGSLISASGGSPGVLSSGGAIGTPGVGGTGSGGNLIISGGAGQVVFSWGTPVNFLGGNGGNAPQGAQGGQSTVNSGIASSPGAGGGAFTGSPDVSQQCIHGLGAKGRIIVYW